MAHSLLVLFTLCCGRAEYGVPSLMQKYLQLKLKKTPPIEPLIQFFLLINIESMYDLRRNINLQVWHFRWIVWTPPKYWNTRKKRGPWRGAEGVRWRNASQIIATLHLCASASKSEHSTHLSSNLFIQNCFSSSPDKLLLPRYYIYCNKVANLQI